MRVIASFFFAKLGILQMNGVKLSTIASGVKQKFG